MTNRYNIANLTDRHFYGRKFLFCLGAYGWTRVLVFADSEESALDECVDWVVDNAPGLLADESVKEEYDRAITEGLDEEKAHERATVDTISGGNCGNYLLAWEVQFDEIRTVRELASVGR